MINDWTQFMKICIAYAKENICSGQYPIAAIVVDSNGEILSSAKSSLNSSCDPTAHPEMVAIRKAAELLNKKYLNGCYLLSTLEPCPMCTSAAIWAKMDGIVYGASQNDAINYSKSIINAKYSWRQITVPAKTIIENGTPRLKLYPHVLRNECLELFI